MTEPDSLQHFGVKGMKWGVRKDRGYSRSTYRQASKDRRRLDRADAKRVVDDSPAARRFKQRMAGKVVKGTAYAVGIGR